MQKIAFFIIQIYIFKKTSAQLWLFVLSRPEETGSAGGPGSFNNRQLFQSVYPSTPPFSFVTALKHINPIPQLWAVVLVQITRLI